MKAKESLMRMRDCGIRGLSVVLVLVLAGCLEPRTAAVHQPDAAPHETGVYWKTIAGLGGGLGNVDGTGEAARFCQPHGVAFDRSGNLYVADYYNYVIRKIAPDGTVRTIAGCVGEAGNTDGAGNSARFNCPTDVAMDRSGTLYVADCGNHVIRKVSPDGTVTSWCGCPGEAGSADGSGRAARFRSPTGLAVAEDGTVFVADTGNHTVRKISPSGGVTTWAGKAAAGGFADGNGAAARFCSPRDVAIGLAGQVFVADAENAVIRKISADGSVTTLAGQAGKTGKTDGRGTSARFVAPQSLATDASGNVFVVDAGNPAIRRITPAGAVSTLSSAPARFASLRGIAVDTAGTIAVSDNEAQTVSRVTAAGHGTLWAGHPSHHGFADGAGSEARFNRPVGIAVDLNGTVFVSDSFSHILRSVSPDGTVTTLAGRVWSSGVDNGKGRAARFCWPGGVAADCAGNVYLADTGNHAVRKVTRDGVVTLLAGGAGASGSSDGKGSLARFSSPSAVAVDRAGNVYVADCGNQLIRKVTPDGTVSTVAGAAGLKGYADGSGATARFNQPTGIAVDTLNNIYVADAGNHVIRRIVPGRQVTTLAGCAGMKGFSDGQGVQARFSGPAAVAVDLTGSLIVADRDNHLIRMVTPEGRVSTLGGKPNSMSSADGRGDTARFAQPSGVAVDRDGVIYVADACNNRIVAGYRQRGTGVRADVRLDSEERPCTPICCEPYAWDVFAGRPGEPGADDGRAEDARLRAPQGLAINGDGVLFTVDGCDRTLRQITPDGRVTTMTGTRDKFVAPIGLALGADGARYVTDSAAVLWKVDQEGVVRRLAGRINQRGAADGIGGAARFSYIPGAAVDRAGNVFLADHNNYTVRKMSPDGKVSTFAGRAGEQGCFDGRGAAARFLLPVAVVADPSGCVFVADDNKIRKITPQGYVTTFPDAAVRFGRLDGLAQDRHGSLYAADRERHVIWKVTPSGRVTRLGGSGLAMAGSGWLVTGLAVDRDGRIYVADAVRNCIIRGIPQKRW